jgi:hypothetical protein
MNYREHGRTFPNQRANAGPLIRQFGLQIILGKVRPPAPPRRGSSTGSDHCSNAITKTLEIVSTTMWLDDCAPCAKLFDHHIDWCHGRHRCAEAQATELSLAAFELAQREAQLRDGAQLGR